MVVLPAIVATGVVELLAWRVGVTIPPGEIARLQHENTHLMWSGNFQNYGVFKVARVALEKPEIVVIGHSRAGQFRSKMFEPYTFYNCGLTAWTFGQVKEVMERIYRAHTPKTFIINLDYFMFSAPYVQHWTRTRAMRYDFDLRSHLDELLTLSRAVKAFPGSAVRNLPRILFARMTHPIDGGEVVGEGTIIPDTAFNRSEGSLLYDAHTRDRAPMNTANLAHILAQVRPGSGERLDRAQIEELRELAALAKKHGTALIGVQLPIVKAAVDLLDSGKDDQFYKASDAGGWRELNSPETKALFDEMGIVFVDLSRLPINADPRHFIDSAHPAEYGVLASVIAMLKDERVRAILPEIDIGRLENKARAQEAEESFFDVYRNEF